MPDWYPLRGARDVARLCPARYDFGAAFWARLSTGCERSRPVGEQRRPDTGEIMEIELNGEKTAVEAGSTVRALIVRLGLNPEQVAVEVNREIIVRALWDERQLQPGDQVEVVHFVGGGGDE